MHYSENIYRLIHTNTWENIRLASELVIALDYPAEPLSALLTSIIRRYLQDLMPDGVNYHRFGCSMTDRTTYEYIFKRLNDFYTIPYIDVEVDAEHILLRIFLYRDDVNLSPILSKVLIEDYTQHLYFSVKAHFSIGTKPDDIFI